MSKICLITGKHSSTGHAVSHSNRKTNRRFDVNLQKRRVWNPTIKRFERIMVSTKGLKTMRKWGW